MLPKLIDNKYLNLTKKPKIEKIQNVSNINYYKLFFNIIGFLIIICGFYVLYIRKLNKIENKKFIMKK